MFTVCATCNDISHVKYVLYFYISTFHILCEVLNMAVFCSSMISFIPGMLLRYCLSSFEMVLVAPIITGITFDYTFRKVEFLLKGLYILESSQLLDIPVSRNHPIIIFIIIIV